MTIMIIVMMMTMMNDEDGDEDDADDDDDDDHDDNCDHRKIWQLTTTISSAWQDSLDHFVSEQALLFNELILVKILWIDNVFLL